MQKTIKIIQTNLTLPQAKKLKSFHLSKFKKEGRKDLKLIIENGKDFKINGVSNPDTFILVAYLKSEFVAPAKPIIEKVESVIKTVTKKVKTIKIKVAKNVLIPIKRFISVNIDSFASHWVWQFIQLGLQTA